MPSARIHCWKTVLLEMDIPNSHLPWTWLNMKMKLWNVNQSIVFRYFSSSAVSTNKFLSTGSRMNHLQLDDIWLFFQLSWISVTLRNQYRRTSAIRWCVPRTLPPQTLGGPLSAVSKPNVARKYALEPKIPLLWSLSSIIFSSLSIILLIYYKFRYH